MTHSIVAKSGDSPVNVGCPQYLPRRPSNGCVDSSRQSYAMLRCSSKTKRVIDGLSIAASAVLFVLTLKRVTYAGQERCSLAQRNQVSWQISMAHCFLMAVTVTVTRDTFTALVIHWNPRGWGDCTPRMQRPHRLKLFLSLTDSPPLFLLAAGRLPGQFAL